MIVDYTQISMKMTEKSIDATPLKPVEVFKILTILSSRLPSLNLSHIETVKIEDSLWPVMMSLTERLYCIKSKERYAIPETTMTVEDILQRYPTTMQLDTPSREDMQTKDGPFAQLRFPMELLATIWLPLKAKGPLPVHASVSSLERSFHFLLYRTPQLTSIKSIDLFLFTVETSRAFYLNPQDAPRPRWPYHTLVRRILFGISMQGSLASLFDATPGCEEIIRSHSSLFRLFVWERSERSWTAAHPAVVRIVKRATTWNS
ncbi:hypothetical protein BC829DRAFT_213088 [Chytridium lagenaria]|nr:hypothetical protein BC829DRAFT_213088 [Chytridium lagenaria]